MSSYYVKPPQKLHPGTFIVSVGIGVPYKHGPYELVKVLVHRGAEKGLDTHSFIFEGEGKTYECSPNFNKGKRKIRAKLEGRLVETPHTLRPFCHPETTVLYV